MANDLQGGGGTSSAVPDALDRVQIAMYAWRESIQTAACAVSSVAAVAVSSLGGSVFGLGDRVEEQTRTLSRVAKDFAAADRVRSIIGVALSEAGYVEGPNDATKFGAWFGMDHNYWCAMFVSWAFAHAGHPLPAVTSPHGFAKVQYGWEYAARTGRLVWTPKSGDIFFIDHGGGRGHTGIVVSVDRAAGTMVTIEGNTNAQGSRNGTMVRSKVRKILTANQGFWRVEGEIADDDRVAPPQVHRTRRRRKSVHRRIAKRHSRRHRRRNSPA